MKQILYILVFTVVFSSAGLAQDKVTYSGDPASKIMRYYPNPATNYVNFEFQKTYDKFFSLEIYNFIGKKVFESRAVTPKITIPLNDYYRGVYIYQLKDRTGKIIESGKFQVAK